MSKRDFLDSELSDAIGLAIVILAVCFGVGGCLRLIQPPEPRLPMDGTNRVFNSAKP